MIDDTSSAASSLIYTVCDIVYEEHVAGVPSPHIEEKNFKKKLKVAHQTSHSVADPIELFIPDSDFLFTEPSDPAAQMSDPGTPTLVEKRISVAEFPKKAYNSQYCSAYR